MTKYVLYLRFSSDLQRETSIEDQRTLCDKRASEMGWDKAGEYIDRGLTGTTMHRRLDLMRMLDDAEKHKFDLVLVEHTDRLSRDMSDLPYIYKCLEHDGVKIFSLSDGYVTPIHLAMRGYQNSEYSKDLGQKVRRGQAGAFKRGVLMGRPPYGYDHIDGKRVINKEQAETVLWIHEQYAAGVRTIEIVQALNAKGLKTKEGAVWTQSILFATKGLENGILRNPMYIGKWRWGIRVGARNPRTGKYEAKRGPEKNIETIDVPELRIVSDELWNAVQARIGKAGSGPLNKRGGPRHLLSRKLFCGICGRGYVCSDKGGLILRCSGHGLSRICDNRRRVSRLRIENLVLDTVQSKLLDPQVLREATKEYCAEHHRRAAATQGNREILRKREAQREREVERLMHALKSAPADGPAYARIAAEMDKLLKELDEVRRDLNAAPVAVPDLDHRKVAERLKTKFSAIRTHLSEKGADAARARDAIRALIDRVTITPMGEPTDRRGGGAVSVQIEGPITELLGLAEAKLLPVTQTYTSECVGQYDRTSTWRITAALEEAHRPNPAAFRRFIDTPFIIAALRAAGSKPLNIRDFVERFLGYLPDRTEFAKIRARVQNCLDHLKVRGAVEQVKVPGKHGTCWHLTSTADTIPLKATLPKSKGKPEVALGEQERNKIVNILAEAGQDLGSSEITRRLLTINGEEPTTERIEGGSRLVRCWLDRLRKDGIVRSIKPPKGYGVNWALVNWADEVAAKSVG